MVKIQYLPLALILTLTKTGCAQMSTHPAPPFLFQCHLSSEPSGQAFTPNIPDIYFNHANAAAFRMGSEANLTLSVRSRMYIYTIPALSAQRRCSGTVVAMEYCYQARDDFILGPDDNRSVFSFLSLSPNGSHYGVIKRFSQRYLPTDAICTPRFASGQREQICCDRGPLFESQIFQIPPSEFTFGILVLFTPLLLFSNSATEFQVEQIQANFGSRIPKTGSDFTLSKGNLVDPLTDLTFPILRLFIEPDIFISEPEMVTPDDNETSSTGRRFFTNSTGTADNSVLIGGIVGAAGVLSTITLVLTVSVVLVRRAKTKASTTHPHQQQGENPTQEEIHITNTHIPVENNQCYGTSPYSDATPSVEGEHNTSYSPQLMAEDHDYDDIV